MAKVKMSDIKSGSENVKNVFRNTMSGIRRKNFKNQTFTNDELLEILYISENIEYHKEKRDMYQKLIKSQKGPFNNAVFSAYSDKLFEYDSMIHLLKNSKGTSEDAKLKWLNYIMVSSCFSAIKFFKEDSGIPYGIDVTKKPFRHVYAVDLIKFSDEMGFSDTMGRRNLSFDYYAELHRILDTMNDAEIYDWYIDSIASTYEKRAMDTLMSYDKMPKKVLENYWHKTNFQNQEILALHPNIPDELRSEMFEKTQNEKYLPQEAKDIFLF